MIQLFSPMLIKARGCIVNNASIGGMRPLVFNGMYGASKAALIQAGEALRLEVAPLGIRVLTLVTGGVSTRFVSKFKAVVLPEKSYYHTIKSIIEYQPEKIPFAIQPEVFARQVLHEVKKGSTGKVWLAGGAMMARLSYWLLPEWVIDRFMLSMKPAFTEVLIEERKKRTGAAAMKSTFVEEQ